VIGFDAAAKAQRTAEAILQRTRAMFARLGMADYTATHTDILGAAKPYMAAASGFEAVMWLAVAHHDRRALELFAREIAPAATSWAPGTTGAAGRPSVAPLVRQMAVAIDKERVAARVALLDGDGTAVDVPLPGMRHAPQAVRGAMPASEGRPVDQAAAGARAAAAGAQPAAGGVAAPSVHVVPLISLAHARSGDKGVTRYELPGIHAFNFVCEQALDGGGMASLRNDPLGKGMAQILLAMPVPVPHEDNLE
jgi:hypothetical protein